MVFTAASAVSSSGLMVSSMRSRRHLIHNSFPINVHRQHALITCSGKFPQMEHFNEPTKLIVILNHTKEKLLKFIPGSVKHFPWQKAESVALHELLLLGKETLKWSLLACFAFSFLSDVVYSIYRNRELMIPFGLFVGTLTAKFLDEISQELTNNDKDGWIKRLVGASSFFVLVKVISTYFSGGNDFILHAGNGGLMQVLWNWKEFPELDGEKSPGDDVSTSLC